MARKLAVFVAALVICLVASAAQQRLILNDGRVVSGEVTKTEGTYRVQTPLGAVEYPESQVASVEDIVTGEMLYQQRLAQIDPSSADDHFHLGELAVRYQLLPQAAEQFGEALRLRPGFEQAALMLQKVEYLMRRGPTTSQSAPAASQPAYGPAITPQEIKDEWLLTAKEINWIRLAELRPADTVRVEIDSQTIERFIAVKRGTGDLRDLAGERRFRALAAMQKALYILNRTTQEDAGLREGIRVLTDPQFMLDYRRVVWPVISRNCATADCHGNDRTPGGLHLFRSDGRDDRIDYTNFVILDGYVARGGGARMMDRGTPSRSLLLQFTLPEQEAELRHPAEARLRAIFPNRRSPGYTAILNWAMSLHRPMHPEYHLTYKPPFGMKLDFSTSPPALTGATSAPAGTVSQRPVSPTLQRPGP